MQAYLISLLCVHGIHLYFLLTKNEFPRHSLRDYHPIYRWVLTVQDPINITDLESIENDIRK